MHFAGIENKYFTEIEKTKPRVSFESRGLSCKMAATYSPAGVQYHRRGRA